MSVEIGSGILDSRFEFFMSSSPPIYASRHLGRGGAKGGREGATAPPDLPQNLYIIV